MCTPRDLVEDTCSIGKLSMVVDVNDQDYYFCNLHECPSNLYNLILILATISCRVIDSS